MLYLRGRNLTVTVTFSWVLLESGRSEDGVDRVAEVAGEIGGFDGVLGRVPPPFAAADGGSCGGFRERNGDMDDRRDLEAEDIGGRERERDTQAEEV